MLGLPAAPGAAVAALARAVPRAVDYGVVRWDEAGRTEERTFVNAVGVGFDAMTASVVPAFKVLPGTAAYLAAVVRTLRLWRSPDVQVSIRAEGEGFTPVYHGPLFLATAGNGVCSGGGFYLTPQATITDGLLDVCVIEGISTGRVFQLIPRALRGRHVGAPEVHMFRTAEMRVESEAGLPIHADGEVLTTRAYRIDVQVVPGGLIVLAPDVR
jgi:diacylglycerol kinase family enzyme